MGTRATPPLRACATRWLNWSSKASRPTPPCTRRSWHTPPFRAVDSISIIWSVAWASSEGAASAMAHLTLSFPLGQLEPERAESACFERGALSVTFSDERDDAVFEPLPGEVRLWPRTRLTALFDAESADAG